MQAKNLQHRKVRIAAVPLINHFLQVLGLKQILKEGLGNARYTAAIEVLIKNMLLEPAALYRIPQWAKHFDAEAIGAGNLNDDLIGRALEKLFRAQRATLQTKLTLRAVEAFEIDVSQIHNDSTTVKFYGAYKSQPRKAVQLKRGHSKDHRPDLKQLLYNLSVARDGAIPIHFKAYDGNRTDDTLHIETWLTLRGMLGCADFLYVADSKLCTTRNMTYIDRNHGRFVTIVPETRAETQEFAEQCYSSQVRWEAVMRRRSTRKNRVFDVFQVATEFYQLAEGFRLYWYRSSEKKTRDKESREERIAVAMAKLGALNEKRPRGRRTARSLEKQAYGILDKLKARSWFHLTVSMREEESFRKTSRGRRTADATYRRSVKRIPVLSVSKNHEQIARSKAMDGIFPLTTNTTLSAKQVLEAYKYQPHIEKRFSGLKSDFFVAPAFLKKTERIEALMFVVYIADLIAALIVRDLRNAMLKRGIESLPTLPEERLSKTPTWEQIQRLFAHHCKYEIHDNKTLLKTFWDQVTEPQRQVINLLPVSKASFTLPP